jgi:hypothetical protein
VALFSVLFPPGVRIQCQKPFTHVMFWPCPPHWRVLSAALTDAGVITGIVARAKRMAISTTAAAMLLNGPLRLAFMAASLPFLSLLKLSLYSFPL